MEWAAGDVLGLCVCVYAQASEYVSSVCVCVYLVLGPGVCCRSLGSGLCGDITQPTWLSTGGF